MTDDRSDSAGSSVFRGLAAFGGRAAGTALRPMSGAMEAAAEAGINLERRALDRLIQSGELEGLLASPRLQAILELMLATDGAKRLIDIFFDSGMFDRLVERLIASDSLWYLVDEIVASPAVTAAISQQGLGFADQLGGAVRERSRRADDWLERTARHVTHRRPNNNRPAAQASGR